MRRRIISGLLALVVILSASMSLRAESIDELKDRAKQGDSAAQHNLGMMYSRGLGVTEDKALAVAWLRLAAKQGNAEAKAELDRIAPQIEQSVVQSPTVKVNTQSTSGKIPPGTDMLNIQTSPPDAAFSVFSKDTFVFSGVAPFHIQNLRNGEYSICFEKQGYDLFWKTISTEGQTPSVTVSLRAVDPQRRILNCIDDLRQTKAREIEDAQETAERVRKEAEFKAQKAAKASEPQTCAEMGAAYKAEPNGSREQRLLWEKWDRNCVRR